MKKKAQTMIEAHDGKKKINEGDLAICIQANRNTGGYNLMVNFDWSFAKDASPQEIKSFLGGFLGNIEEVFGEKMVAEAIMHYADDMGHIVDTPQGKGLYLRSKGLDYKNWKKKVEDES